MQVGHKTLRTASVSVIAFTADLDKSSCASNGAFAKVAWIENESWTRLRGVSADGVVLVRPDGHVAWRSHAGALHEAGEPPWMGAHRVLSAALAQLLFLDSAAPSITSLE